MSSITTRGIFGFEAFATKACGMASSQWPLEFIEQVRLGAVDRIYTARNLEVTLATGAILNFTSGSLNDCATGQSISLVSINAIYLENTGENAFEISFTPASALGEGITLYPGQRVLTCHAGDDHAGGVEFEFLAIGGNTTVNVIVAGEQA